MIRIINRRILRIRKAYGLEISFLSGDEMTIQAVVLRLEKSRIVKEKEVHGLTSFRELSGVIPAGSPVAITINGKGTLFKTLPVETLSADVFESVLPNGNPGEFYVQVGRYQNTLAVQIVRKLVVQDVLEKIIQAGYKPLRVGVGVSDLQFLLPYFNLEGKSGEIRTNHFIVRINEQKSITGIEPAPLPAREVRPSTEYNIGDQYVYGGGVMAFGSAVGLLAGRAFEGSGSDGWGSDGSGSGGPGSEGWGSDGSEITNEQLAGEREEFRFLRYFKAAFRGFIGVLFLVLLVNFVLFSHYARINSEQQTMAMVSLSTAKQEAGRKTAVQAKVKWMSSNGWDQPSRMSLYADRIAALVPDDAALTTMKINPVNSNFMGGDGVLKFQRDTIEITGTCGDPVELNRFVNNLRNIRYFRDISIRSYSYKKEIGEGSFSMEIISL
jgi:Tfp pilus assembly protein PilN